MCLPAGKARKKKIDMHTKSHCNGVLGGTTLLPRRVFIQLCARVDAFGLACVSVGVCKSSPTLFPYHARLKRFYFKSHSLDRACANLRARLHEGWALRCSTSFAEALLPNVAKGTPQYNSKSTWQRKTFSRCYQWRLQSLRSRVLQWVSTRTSSELVWPWVHWKSFQAWPEDRMQHLRCTRTFESRRPNISVQRPMWKRIGAHEVWIPDVKALQCWLVAPIL